MTYAEEKKLKDEQRERIASLTDTEKLNYIVELLSQEVEMLTDGSDTYGITFTHEYNQQQDKIEEFLEIMKRK